MLGLSAFLNGKDQELWLVPLVKEQSIFKRAIVGFVMLLPVAACAIAPARSGLVQQLGPVNLSQLQPGVSTQVDLQSKFGTPAYINHWNKVRTVLTYQNAFQEGEALNLRYLQLGFLNGVLSFYHYRSNYADGSTCFDFVKARYLIEIANTPKTRAQVITALGLPTGLTSEHGLGNHHVESYECVTRDRVMHISMSGIHLRLSSSVLVFWNGAFQRQPIDEA